MRTPVAGENPKIYNDLSRVEQELEEQAAETRDRIAEADARPIPKLKKYYKKK